MCPHDLPSSPSSASSCAGSLSSPLTPTYCFSPTPAIVTPDDFTMLEASPNRSISVPSPESSEPSFVSSDDGKLRVFLRNKGRWENMYDRFESSPSRVPLLPQDNTSDSFFWDPTHSAVLDAHRFPDSSRCSLLIQEVSLLVGLTPEHDHLLPADGYPAALDGSNRVSDVLPFTLTPTKSLAPRKHRNTNRSRPTSTSSQPRPSNIAILSNPNTQSNPSIHDGKPVSIGSTGFATPTLRHKYADADRSSLSASRRQARVFNFKPPVGVASRPDALELDKTFLDPREPPPKPISNPTANRCSSLDRLECSLMKLEAYAPYNHRKSRSDERAPVRVAQKSDKRPSLPPPRRLKKPQSSHDFAHRNASHPALPSSHPFPKQMPVRPCNTPQVQPVASLNHEDHEHALTPGSFMDMDITRAEEASRKRQECAHHEKKMKGLVSVAKRVSRGVIAWGKNLTGSTKPSNKVQDAVTTHDSRF